MSSLEENYDILLAEDDPDDVEILEKGLQKADIKYELRLAQDGDKLFALLKEKLPYILFLDINMPCRDGLSCVKAIRKNSEYDSLPVIIYSGRTTPQNIHDAYRSGANLFMAKTFTLQDLVNNLKQVFAIDWRNYQHFPARDQFLIS